MPGYELPVLCKLKDRWANELRNVNLDEVTGLRVGVISVYLGLV